MSTSISDFASAARIGASVLPAELTESANGAGVDLLSADGPCFAVQSVGEVSGTISLAGRIEESADGTNWSAITGATFTAVTDENNLQAITFRRTARFVRWACTITGSTPTALTAVVIGEQKKTI